MSNAKRIKLDERKPKFEARRARSVARRAILPDPAARSRLSRSSRTSSRSTAIRCSSTSRPISRSIASAASTQPKTCSPSDSSSSSRWSQRRSIGPGTSGRRVILAARQTDLAGREAIRSRRHAQAHRVGQAQGVLRALAGRSAQCGDVSRGPTDAARRSLSADRVGAGRQALCAEPVHLSLGRSARDLRAHSCARRHRRSPRARAVDAADRRHRGRLQDHGHHLGQRPSRPHSTARTRRAHRSAAARAACRSAARHARAPLRDTLFHHVQRAHASGRPGRAVVGGIGVDGQEAERTIAAQAHGHGRLWPRAGRDLPAGLARSARPAVPRDYELVLAAVDGSLRHAVRLHVGASEPDGAAAQPDAVVERPGRALDGGAGACATVPGVNVRLAGSRRSACDLG